PFQLVAKDLEIIAVLWQDCVKSIRALSELDHIAGNQVQSRLSVRSQHDFLLSGVDPERNLDGIRQHDRAVGQGMWANRGQADSLSTRIHDWTSRGEIISSGTRGCRDDETVPSVSSHRAAAYPAVDLDYSGQRRAVNGHIVKHSAGPRSPVVAQALPVKHRAVLCFKVS